MVSILCNTKWTTDLSSRQFISIPRASLDNITEGDEEWDNIIDMEQGDVPNANYPRDFLMKHFEGADSMLKSVMLKEKKNVREGGNPWKGGV